MTTQKIWLTHRLPGMKVKSLDVWTGTYNGAPFVRVIGRNKDDEAMSSYDLMFHADVLPDLIAAMRWVVAGPLEQQLIDKELER